MTWRKYDDVRFFSKGAVWCVDTQAMLSLFQQIDYAYSAVVALTLLYKSNKNKENISEGLTTDNSINDVVQDAAAILKELIKG